ncbi:hypothetical protein ABZ839_33280 [Streptomyces cellulosae]
MLIRGAFAPGLSDLDSGAQVLRWAAAFGAARHLVTRLADDRAQMTLSEVGQTTDAVMDPERATVKTSARSWRAGHPGRLCAGPHEEPDTVTRSDGDGNLVPDGASAQRRAGA